MLTLTCAISEYDHVRDMESGRVRPEGIDLSILIMPVEEVFFRTLRFQEFDVAEMSMGRYVALLAQGSCPFVALPVFPSRMFRHSSIYVRRDRSIHTPADLRGKRVGIPEWAQTAGIYARGVLSEQFQVACEEIQWVQAGIHQVGREEEVALQLPPTLHLSRVTDRTLNDMLLSGELDGVMTAHPPDCFNHGNPTIGRLFENFLDDEHRYWKNTGIFPIMHTILVRREIFERHRWVAMNLLRAFTEAKVRSIERIREVTAARVPLPWAQEYARRLMELFGEDYWPYGIEPNRTTLSAFLKYASQQYVTSRHLTVDELFPNEVSAQFKI